MSETREERLAGEYVYELCDVAEHVGRMSEGVRAAVGRGDFDLALEDLNIMKRSAEQIERRLRAAISAVEEAKRAKEAAHG